ELPVAGDPPGGVHESERPAAGAAQHLEEGDPADENVGHAVVVQVDHRGQPGVDAHRPAGGRPADGAWLLGEDAVPVVEVDDHRKGPAVLQPDEVDIAVLIDVTPAVN